MDKNLFNLLIIRTLIDLDELGITLPLFHSFVKSFTNSEKERIGNFIEV